MFGLFRKKKKAANASQPAFAASNVPVAPAPVQHAALPPAPASLLAFESEVAQLRSAFAGYLQQKSEESSPLLESMGNNLSALDQVWNPAEQELEQATLNLKHAWNRASSSLTRERGSQEQKGGLDRRYEVEKAEMEFDFTRAFRHVRALAANALMQRALHTDARTRVCVSCAQPMVNLLVGQSQNMNCPACGVMQLVEPGNDFRLFAVSAALWVGEWDAIEHWLAMKRTEVQIRQYRERAQVPLPLLQNYHNAAQACYSTTFGVEAQLVPPKAAHIPRQMKAHMKDVNRLLRDHWQWREFEASQG